MLEEKTVIKADSELRELIPTYLSSRAGDVDAISDALKRGDYDTVERLGHSMKGSGGGYGFDFITELGGLLELAARQSDDEEIKTHVIRLKRFLDSLEVVYE